MNPQVNGFCAVGQLVQPDRKIRVFRAYREAISIEFPIEAGTAAWRKGQSGASFPIRDVSIFEAQISQHKPALKGYEQAEINYAEPPFQITELLLQVVAIGDGG